jgi:hypothetical protein
VVQRLTMGRMIRGSSAGRGWKFFSSPPHPDRLSGPSLAPYPIGNRDMKLTTHLHLEPRSRMRGAITPLPNTPLWRGAQLKKAQRQLYLYYKSHNPILRFICYNELHSTRSKLFSLNLKTVGLDVGLESDFPNIGLRSTEETILSATVKRMHIQKFLTLVH